MGITNSNKQMISTSQIDCGGTLKITLALSAAPDIASNPTDIVLILDRSGSMTGAPLANMKTGADTFIDIIDEATDGSQDGTIGSGSRIGIVSFSDTAAADTQLITSVAALKSAVNGLNAGGSTNHADAFAKAVQLFEPASPNARVIVMFTDGKTTSGVPPAPIAAAARASGIIIYCIGLVGDDGIDVSVLNDWATDPDASHSVIPPTKGTAMMVSNTALQWKILTRSFRVRGLRDRSRSGALPCTSGTDTRRMQRFTCGRFRRCISGIPGQNRPARCNCQERMPAQTGGTGCHPYRGGFIRGRTSAGLENDHCPRPQLFRLQGYPGEMY